MKTVVFTHELMENFKLVQTMSISFTSHSKVAGGYMIDNEYSLLYAPPPSKLMSRIQSFLSKKFNLNLNLNRSWIKVRHSNGWSGYVEELSTRSLSKILKYLIIEDQLQPEDYDKMLVAMIPTVTASANDILSKYDIDKIYEVCSNTGELIEREHTDEQN